MTASAMLLVVAALSQVGFSPAPADAQTQTAVERAVTELGHARFEARERASEFLWQQGTQAEEALRRAARSEQLEIRLRAVSILRDFEYGIRPEVPEELLRQIRQFRVGSDQTRRQVVHSLAEDRHWPTLIQLLKREANLNARRRLLVALLQSGSAIRHFGTLEELQTLVDAVAPDQEPLWRRGLVAELLFSPPMIRRLAGDRQLTVLAEFLEAEEDARVRMLALGSAFKDPASIDRVMQDGQWPLLHKFLAAAPPELRPQLMTQVMGDERLVARIEDAAHLDQLLGLVLATSEGLNGGMQPTQLFDTAGMRVILDKRGIDAVLASLKRDQDAAQHGERLAVLMRSPTVQQWLTNAGRADAVVDIATKDSPIATRRAYIRGLFRGGAPSEAVTARVQRQFWNLIKQDEDLKWQLETIAIVLNDSGMQRIAAEQQEAVWLLQRLQGAHANQRSMLLQTLVFQAAWLSAVLEQGHLDDLTKAIKSIDHPTQPATLLGRVVRASGTIDYLRANERLERLVTLAKELPSEASRFIYLQSLLANRLAVAALLDAGHYDVLTEVILAMEDAEGRAQLFGSLARHEATLRFLTQRDQLEILIDFAKQQKSPQTRASFLKVLFSSDAMPLLLDAGFYDDLQSFLEEESASKDELAASFYGNAEVLKHFLQHHQSTDLINLVESSGPITRHQILQRIASARNQIGSLAEAGQIQPFIALITQLPNANQRADMLGNVLLSPDLIRHLAQRDELGFAIQVVREEPDSEARLQLIRRLFSHNELLTFWIGAKQLDQVIALAHATRNSLERADVLGGLLDSQAVIDYWSQEDQLERLLELAGSFEDPAGRQQYLGKVYGSYGTLQKLIANGLLEKLLEAASREPPNVRGRWMRAVAQNPATPDVLQAEGGVIRLLTIAADEPDEAVRQEYFAGLVSNGAAITMLVNGGHYQSLVDRILAFEPAVQGYQLFGRLVQHSSVVTHLSQQNMLSSLLVYAETQSDERARSVFLQGLFTSVATTKLIEQGHYRRMRSFAEQESPAQDSLAALLYSHPAVLERLLSAKEFAPVFEHIDALSESARAEFLGRLTSNSETTAELIRAGHHDALLSLIRALPTAAQRMEMIGKLLASPEVLSQLVAQGSLQHVVEMAKQSRGPNSGRGLAGALVRGGAVDVWVRADLLDQLFQLVLGFSEPREQPALLSQVVAADSVLRHWEKQGQLSRVFAPVDSLEAAFRPEYVQRVLLRNGVLRRLIAAGLWEEVLETVDTLPGDQVQAAVVASIARDTAAAEQLADSGLTTSLFSFARDHPSAAVRAGYLQGIIYNGRTIAALVEAGHHDALVAWVLSTDDEVRRASLLGQLSQQGSVAQHLQQQGKLSLLVEFPESQEVAAAKVAFLQPLFDSNTLSLLLEQGYHDRLQVLLEDVASNQNASEHSRELLVARFYANASVLGRIQDSDPLRNLIQRISAMGSAEARYEFLTRALSNPDQLKRLIDARHIEAVTSVVQQDPENHRRQNLLRLAITSSRAVDQFAARQELSRVIEILRSERSNEVRMALLDSLISDPAMSAKFVQAGLLPGLLSMIEDHPDGPKRGEVLGKLLGSSSVTEYLIAKDDLELTLRMVQRGKAAGVHPALRSLAQSLMRDSKALSRWVAAGMLDRLIDLILADPDLNWRADTLGRLVTADPILDAWSKGDQLESILALAERVNDEQMQDPRHRYLTQVYTSFKALQVLIEAGQFEELLDVATEASHADPRRGLLASLLRSPAIAKHLRGQGQLERMLELVRREEQQPARESLLAAILRNDAAVAGLIETEQFEPLVHLARQLPSAGERKPAMAQFLYSPLAVEYLEGTGELDAIVRSLIHDMPQDLSSQFMQEMLRHGSVLAAFETAEAFGDLIRAVEAVDAQTRGKLLNRILAAPGGARLLVAHDRIPLVLSTLEGGAGEPTNRGTLQMLLHDPEFLRALGERKSLGTFLDVVETSSQYAGRGVFFAGSVWETVNWSGEVLLVLAEHDQLDRLLTVARKSPRSFLLHSLVRSLLSSKAFESLGRPQLAARLVDLASEASTQQNASMLNMVLYNQPLRKTLIADGQVDLLLESLPHIPNEEQRERLRQSILVTSSELMARRIQQPESHTAREILATHAAESEEGAALLAAFLLTQGGLEPRIRELQGDESAPAHVLAYLLRAHGDYDAAVAVALRTDNASLIHYLTCEHRDWHSAAEQLAAGSMLPPAPLRPQQQTTSQAELERLSFLAAYWRLAGDAEQAGKAVQQIERFAMEQAGDRKLQRRAAEALLLNGSVAPGLRVLQSADPAQAFEAFAIRHQYSAALAAIGSEPGSAFDQDWYLSLPQSEAADPFAAELNAAQQRLVFAMRVVEILQQLGLEEDAERILLTLETYTRTQPEQTADGQPWRRMHAQWLAVELYRLGFHERAWRHASEAIAEPSQANALLIRMFKGRANEATAWWTSFTAAAGEPAEQASVEERLRRIHEVLHLRVPRAGEAFEQLVQQATRSGAVQENQRGSHLLSLADTCIARARPDIAEQLIRQSGKQDTWVHMKLGDVLRKQQKWAEAGEVLMEVWQADEEQLAALYLSGDSLVHAGNREEGERRQALADRLALSSHARYRMAGAMALAGLTSEAAEQWRIVARTAPLASWEWYDSLRRVADEIRGAEPALAADLWEQYSLSLLRTNRGSRPVDPYLRMPYLIHWRRAAAAIETDDPQDVWHQAQLALAAMPSGVEMAEHLIPKLRASGDEETAGRLHERVRQHYLDALKQFPQSPRLHNELAWLNARCHRHLDEALAHAEQAVELRPRHPGHIDTLAEVHFQRGNRERAIELSQQSLELAPGTQLFQDQLERFQNAPLPTPSPDAPHP